MNEQRKTSQFGFISCLTLMIIYRLLEHFRSTFLLQLLWLFNSLEASSAAPHDSPSESEPVTEPEKSPELAISETDFSRERAIPGAATLSARGCSYHFFLYYSNARWYDASLGRFITEDPIKDGLNWYVYCGNNPMTMVDPTGLLSDEHWNALDEMSNSGAPEEAIQQATDSYTQEEKEAIQNTTSEIDRLSNSINSATSYQDAVSALQQIDALQNNLVQMKYDYYINGYVEIEEIFVENRNGKTRRTTKGVTIHDVGENYNNTPEDWIEYWETSGTNAHFIVDNGRVINTIPVAEYAIHSSTSGSTYRIGIEMRTINGDRDVTEKTINSTARITAYLLDKHGLTGDNIISRHSDDMVQDYGYSLYDCPKSMVKSESKWQGFVNTVNDIKIKY